MKWVPVAGLVAALALSAVIFRKPAHEAPARVVEKARSLLPIADTEIERLTDVVGREPRWAQPLKEERAEILDEPLVVPLEEPIEGTGWREPHRRVSESPIRFVGPGRRAWLDLPVRLPPACEIELVVVSDDLAHCDHLVLEVNGVPVEVQWIPQDLGRLGKASLPDDYASTWEFTSKP